MKSISTSPGVYALLLVLHEPITLNVGRLGEAFFPAGDYVYLGSARGPGGLRARLGRHLRSGKSRRATPRPHWHIDHLRRRADVFGYCYRVLHSEGHPAEMSSDSHPGSFECAWSQAVGALPGAHIPLPRFGASDCRSGCAAHLVAFPREGQSEKQIHAELPPSRLARVLSTASDTSCHAVFWNEC